MLRFFNGKLGPLTFGNEKKQHNFTEKQKHENVAFFAEHFFPFKCQDMSSTPVW